MQAKDVFAPKVFLCKAGRFLENIVNKNMDVKDYDAQIREKFGSDEFADSCDPNHFNGIRSSDNNLESDSDSESQNENEEVDIEDSEQPEDSNFVVDEGPFPGGEVIEVSKQELDELPIIVFEGKTPTVLKKIFLVCIILSLYKFLAQCLAQFMVQFMGPRNNKWM